MVDFDSLPPSLKKLILVWIEPENWTLNLMQACEKAGIKYKSAKNLISRIGSEDFYELKAQLVRKALAKEYPKVIRALVEKAKNGSTRAIELVLKMRGELADKIELSGGIDISIQNSLLEAKKKLEELERE